MMAIMDLFNRTPTPTPNPDKESLFLGYPYYDFCLTLPGVDPRTIRLQTGSSTNPLMSGLSLSLSLSLYRRRKKEIPYKRACGGHRVHSGYTVLYVSP